MRKMLLVSVAALSIGLASCSTLNNSTSTFLGEVQAFTAQACKFVPTIATILSLFNAGIATTVGGLATAICASVPPPASAKFSALPRYGAGPAVTTGNIGTIPINGWRTP